MELGYESLPAEDQARLFVQMGSTLRNLKEFQEAKKVLREGIERFPATQALKAFLGLTQYSDGHYRKAAKLFLQASVPAEGDTSMRDYARALKSYFDVIDTYPKRQRNWMRIYLHDATDPGEVPSYERIIPVHEIALRRLMESAFRNSIDFDGKTAEQYCEDVSATLQGTFGPFLSEASFVCLDGPTAKSASLVTLWKEKPLLEVSMTDPAYQGQGLAGFLIRKSMYVLKCAGYKALYLVVTEGNSPAEHLYAKLGFELLGPFLPKLK
jgi:GNAT superfamily N-acetyltransferase